ncbi:MAG: YkgJ family cysteine cluster protein [archaeon]
MTIGAKFPKLTKNEEANICLSCGECCKRYWITVLPEEAKKIARFRGVQIKDFLENDCILNVKLFTKTTPGVLTFPSTFLPKPIYDVLKKEMNIVPESFFIVPQVVLKRNEKTVFNFNEKKTKKEIRNACLYLMAENACEIYPARPAPCRLFPFIAMPDYREQYPFCGLYQRTSKDFSIESKIYYGLVQQYFKTVDEKSFSSIWRYPPTNGFIFLGEKQIGKITLSELIQMTPKK